MYVDPVAMDVPWTSVYHPGPSGGLRIRFLTFLAGPGWPLGRPYPGLLHTSCLGLQAASYEPSRELTGAHPTMATVMPCRDPTAHSSRALAHATPSTRINPHVSPAAGTPAYQLQTVYTCVGADGCRRRGASGCMRT